VFGLRIKKKFCAGSHADRRGNLRFQPFSAKAGEIASRFFDQRIAKRTQHHGKRELRGTTVGTLQVAV
jgi:hypothetical protein